MQFHTAEQLESGPAAGRWAYVCSGRRTWYIECCIEPYAQIMRLPEGDRDDSPLWEQVGHETRDEAYAHMRSIMLDRLTLDRETSNWSGCRAPVDGRRCDVPTKGLAAIEPLVFLAPLCDEHRTREVVEAMWQGPGDCHANV